MTEWIISGNPQKFDLINAFQDLGKIDWRQSANIQKGDIVYIYVSEGYQSIKYKCKVNKVDLDHIEIDDSKYYLTNELDRTNKYMELEPIEVFNTFLFSKSYLDKHSFNPPQGPVRVSNNVLQYLNIVQDLLHSNEMDPDKHDGSYELIRETILSYKNMGNLALVDDKDLNLLYHMVIGSWRHGFDKKKESIFKSHLLEKEKQRLIQILDFVLEKAKNGLYTNKEGDEVSVGMFGTGFYIFKTNKEDVSNFIELCINIIDEQDDNRIYDISDSVLKNGIMGMKSASASVILHCLKPFVFPIFNSNAGNRDIFEYLGIEIEKRESLEYYIANCRKVKEFRDKNFKFKNYRILDMEARNLGSPDNEKTEQNNSWNKNNNGKRYWLYSPGNDAEDWEEQYNNGIIAIGKDAIGDLKVFKSKEEMRKKMQEIINPQKDFSQSANVSWQFANVMKPGDIVYARKGLHKIISRGVVIGDYEFDISRKHHKNIHKIKWTHTGDWDYPDTQASRLTLIDLTPHGELVKIIEDLFGDKGNNKVDNNNSKTITNNLNTILYGPPGTGKTYNTVIEALKIVEPELIKEYEDKEKTYDDIKAEFNRLKVNGQIEFITFHQSYSYEEFVEGIKPDLSDEWGNSSENLTYKGTDGVFKKIANRALFDRLEIKEDKKNKILNFGYIKDKFIEKYQVGDELETIKSKSKFKIEKYTEDSIRIRPSNSEYIYSVSYNYLEEAFNKNLKKDEDIVNIIGMPKGLTSYYRSIYCELIDLYNIEIKNRKGKENNRISTNEEISNEQKRRLVKEYYENKLSLKEDINESEKYVLIIDEINRGNISKIFGELITLLEEDKRENLSVRLPYSHEEFTVPKNLYIIGTMNTSDRSIASIDIALRRRFTFKEMMPDSKLVADFGVEFSKKFEELNNRIRILLDRDHQIGHSYFIKDKYENANTEKLKEIWFNSIMPLLNEYFYNDWEKLRALLGEPNLNGGKWFSFIKEIKGIEFANKYEIDNEEQYDFVYETEIDFEEALNHAFPNQIEYKEKE